MFPLLVGNIGCTLGLYKHGGNKLNFFRLGNSSKGDLRMVEFGFANPERFGLSMAASDWLEAATGGADLSVGLGSSYVTRDPSIGYS